MSGRTARSSQGYQRIDRQYAAGHQRIVCRGLRATGIHLAALDAYVCSVKRPYRDSPARCRRGQRVPASPMLR